MRVTIATKFPNVGNKISLFYERSKVEDEKRVYFKEVDFSLEGTEEGTTNSLLRCNGRKYTVYTYEIDDKVKRFNPKKDDTISLKDFIDAVKYCFNNSLLDHSLKIVETPEISKELKKIIDDKNFESIFVVNNKVLGEDKKVNIDATFGLDLENEDLDNMEKIEEIIAKAKAAKAKLISEQIGEEEVIDEEESDEETEDDEKIEWTEEVLNAAIEDGTVTRAGAFYKLDGKSYGPGVEKALEKLNENV